MLRDALVPRPLQPHVAAEITGAHNQLHNVLRECIVRQPVLASEKIDHAAITHIRVKPLHALQGGRKRWGVLDKSSIA